MDASNYQEILSQIDIGDLDRRDLEQAVAIVEELQRRQARRKINAYYPDTGPLRRELYRKHIEFFAAGARYRERCMIAANRVGKSEGVGAYECALHLTGQYPDWWVGKKFNRPVRMWAAGDTGKTVRDIIQYKLIGPLDDTGTGMIPGDAISGLSPKQGLSEAIELIRVRHASGGESVCVLKSYDQKRKSFQGTEQDVIWLDEEPPMAIYTECLLRTMTTAGIVLCTFTPLLGISDVVKSFMPSIGHHGHHGKYGDS
jgi:phage terminase large subunit-like protein